MRERQFAKLLEADTARISRPMGKLFLIIGYNRHTKDDSATRWLKNGEPFDFAYLEEHVVASGNTMKELEDSAREYKRLQSITMEQYLHELAKCSTF